MNSLKDRVRNDWDWWLWTYLLCYVLILIGSVIGFASGCASSDLNGLRLGCSDSISIMPMESIALGTLIVSGLTVASGVAAALTRGRKINLAGVLVWISAGPLLIAFIAVDHLSVVPEMATPLFIIGSALLAIPTGVSMTSRRSNDKTGSNVSPSV